MPDDRTWRLLGFQGNGNRHRLSFTINVTLADKAAWEAARSASPWRGPRPSGNVYYPLPAEVCLVERIGPSSRALAAIAGGNSMQASRPPV